MEIFLTGAAAAAAGAAAAFLNYRLTVFLMNRGGAGQTAVSFVRQLVNIAFLVLAFFIGKALPFSQTAVLVGAVIGLTGCSTVLLLTLAKKTAPGGAAPSAEKAEGDGDGDWEKENGGKEEGEDGRFHDGDR
ncbi:MAG: hypothetical protein II534_04690 [Clostridia bacterium]|nr:hypothetical protein [Clostridia bacterium]